MRERETLEILDTTLYALLRDGARKEQKWAKKMALREVNIPLEDFPSLFSMEAHTGYFGMFFASIWFALAALYFPDIQTLYLIFAVAICATFIILFWISVNLSSLFASRISELNTIADPIKALEAKDALEYRVRKWISFLSTSYVIVCCVLIWLTGGVTSPFTPFYIMIFTLTISKNKVPYPGVFILLYFLFAILVAAFAREIWPWPISREDMVFIQQSWFYTAIYLFFICASLIVPTISAYLVERRDNERLERQKRRSWKAEDPR